MRCAALFLVGLLLGVAVGVWIPSELTPIEREVAAAEARCKAHAKPGHAVYVVTRYGSLRGCIVVPELARPGERRKVQFVWEGVR